MNSIGYTLFFLRHKIDEYLHPDHHAAYLKRSLASDLSNIEETYFADKRGNFWVVVDESSDEKKIVGMVACEPKNDGGSISTCELRRMSVHKDYRGQRIASMLMDCFLQHARDYGFQKIILSCWPHQGTAIALYQKYGFKQIDERVVGFHGVKVADFELVL